MEDNCEHSHVCHLSTDDIDSEKCILHSENPDKSVKTFEDRLESHIRENGLDFRQMVFPAGSMPFTDLEVSFFAGVDREGVNCRGATFQRRVNFKNATFLGGADFSTVSFQGSASFEQATFEGPARFGKATFQSGANFRDATIRGEANFRSAEILNERANFLSVTVTGKVYFLRTDFEEGLNIVGAELRKAGIIASSDLGYSDLRHITLGGDVGLRFRDVSLEKCQLVGTDLRAAEFVDVDWCTRVSSDGFCFDEWFSRSGIYDEIIKSNSEQKVGNHSSWEEIEQAYRQLKVRYEERGDFPRGGDFHIGQKVARRKSAWRNLSKDWGQWVLLSLYRGLSKYGERALPAIVWLVALVLGCAAGYLAMGGVTESVCLTSWSIQDFSQALLLSGEATLFPVQSAGFQKLGPRTLNLLQRTVSPVVIALVALAIRQRVKR